jgi:hypothetical protein
LLKVEFIRNSSSSYCLIVDADTILLNPRPWIDESLRIGLTPTDELVLDYHQFLISIGVISEPPIVSFVPHHMFYDVESFKCLMGGIGFHDPISILETMDKHIDKSSASPLSIDYELYGQWMLAKKPDEINLIKWSNLGISRSRAERILNSNVLIRFLGIFYNSISFHDYS